MLGRIKVKVKGVCAQIHNNPDNPVKATKQTDTENPEWRRKEFLGSLYRNGKGLYQPSEHFEKCLELAGAMKKFQGKMTYSSIIKGGITIEPNRILIPKKFKPVPFTKWVRIPPRTGARVKKTRAVFNEWELSFFIEVLNDAINFDDLKEILVYGGLYKGVADWRPKYGRFKVIEFKGVK